MPRPMSLAALALILAAQVSAAHAGVTPQEVWSAWGAGLRYSGATLTATERAQPDGRLDLLDLRLTLPEGVVLGIERVSLAPQADGSVSVLLPGSFVMQALAGPQGALRPEAEFNVSAPGFAATIRDLGLRLDFDVSAPSLAITLDEASIRRAEVEEDLSFALAIADLTAHWTQDLASSTQTVDAAVDLGTIHADGRIDAPDGTRGTFSLDLSAIEGSLGALIPPEPPALGGTNDAKTLPDFLPALAAGLFLKADLRHGPAALLIDGIDPASGPIFLLLETASEDGLLSLDKTAMVIDSGMSEARLTFRSEQPEMPVPELSLGLKDYRTTLRFGLNDMVSPQDWSVLARMTELTLSDSLWAAMDPRAMVPRDPMSLVLDLGGTWALDPTALTPGRVPPISPDAAPPFTTLTASLNELLVKGLGVELTGTGALDFDMSDLATYDGMPAPTGTLSFAASGLNRWMDTAAATGALTPDELTALRFALLFIGKAGDGPDSLTSTIEFDGPSISLNGQKLR